MKALRQQVLRGSIPMCMGPPTWNAIAPGIGWVYPHVYGATHAVRCGLLWFRGLSPCVWGHRSPDHVCTLLPGCIPMCMGPPAGASTNDLRGRVYPHVYVATISAVSP